MSRLEVPLAYRKLRTTGDVVVHAELIMAIKTNRGTWEPFPFLIDSGTEMTTMAAGEAKYQNLPMPTQPVSGLRSRAWKSALDCFGGRFQEWTRPNMSSRVTSSVIPMPDRYVLATCLA